MASTWLDLFKTPEQKAKDAEWHPPLLPPSIQAPPGSTSGSTTKDAPGASGGGGGSSDGGASAAAAAAAAATAKAKADGKAQTAKENANTQAILDQLLGALGGFASGRDVQVNNANKSLDDTLLSILQNYNQASQDYQKSGDANDADQAAKSAANVTNRARERMSLLQNAASQGAGETDQMKAQIQAFLNGDANQQEVDRAYQDTNRSILSQIAGANNQAETQRRSAWAQNQEAIGKAQNDYFKNMQDTLTNIQRTAAQNNNVDSDYVTGFTADFKGHNPVSEAAQYAGKTYQAVKKDDQFFRNWDGKIQPNSRNESNTSNRAAAVTIKAPKAAEGATLRGKS
jgi:hypothetical protein